MSKTKSRLITLPRLLILSLLGIVFIMGAWMFLRTAMVKYLTEGIAELEKQNYEIGHSGLSVGGFPFSLDATMADISVRAPISENPDLTKNWAVKSDRLDVHSTVLTPLSWDIEHRGQMRLDMRGQNGERYLFDITPAAIDARVVVAPTGTLKSARFDMGGAQLDALVGTPPIISQFGQLSADIKVAQNIGHISMSGAGLQLSPKIPTMLDKILGRKLALVQLDANIANWALLEAGNTDAWGAQNSHISSDHLTSNHLTSDYWAVQWGPADMVGDFDITFNNGLPEGKIQIRIKNPEPLIDKIISSGLVPKNYAGTINTLMALRETEDDGRKSIDITIKDGVVKTGFIPIYEFQKPLF